MEGFRIREVRVAQDMTLSHLASAAGVSSALISQVERGLVDPSLETLRKISRVLNVPLFELLDGDRPERLVAVVRREDQVRITSPRGDVSYARHSAGYGQLEMLRGTLQPGGVSHSEPWSHPAEECLVVMSGSIVAEIEGSRFVLAEGDSCHFDSNLPHRLLNESDEVAVFTIAVTPPSY